MGANDLMQENDIQALSAITGTREERREKIQTFEDTLKTLDDVEHLTVLKHAFLDGAYFRQITIPAGVALTGKIHTHETCNLITRGKIAIVSEFDERIIEAPFMYISQPGAKKACYTLEETTLINCHITEETDLEAIESDVTQNEYQPVDERGRHHGVVDSRGYRRW